ncbi:serine/arginine-rich splicing factor SR45-like [Zingiber officinale]|uniref:serine/arginine-rich splicing factor SR45-like n=1 Tax=Zingiber officinale TaxID=94328 RepID=UPI001C4D1810|nr:serine/arginine-rich splicing factor SR45-like [Zingiber officinale]XP_042385141.1 serine/arginine-rich splicing factor SR45-like [Zingiber officinale]
MVEDNYRNSAIEIMKNFQFAYEQTKKLEQKLKNFEKELKLKNIELEKKNKELQKLKEMLKGKTKENEDAENIGERSPLPPRRRSPPRHGRSPSRRSPPLHRHRSRSPMRGRSPSPRRGNSKASYSGSSSPHKGVGRRTRSRSPIRPDKGRSHSDNGSNRSPLCRGK